MKACVQWNSVYDDRLERGSNPDQERKLKKLEREQCYRDGYVANSLQKYSTIYNKLALLYTCQPYA